MTELTEKEKLEENNKRIGEYVKEYWNMKRKESERKMQELSDKLKREQFRLDWTNENPSTSFPDFEKDENGTLYGYKVLWLDTEGLHSPRGDWWIDGTLQSNEPPTETNIYGIYGLKRCSELEQWWMYYHSPRFSRTTKVIVKIALWGDVVETAYGFRAEHAQVIDVAHSLTEAFEKWS